MTPTGEQGPQKNMGDRPCHANLMCSLLVFRCTPREGDASKKEHDQDQEATPTNVTPRTRTALRHAYSYVGIPMSPRRMSAGGTTMESAEMVAARHMSREGREKVRKEMATNTGRDHKHRMSINLTSKLPLHHCTRHRHCHRYRHCHPSHGHAHCDHHHCYR